LLIAEAQMINAVHLIREFPEPPHIVIGMAHHPCHLLQDHDRRLVQRRIDDVCHFFHSGHLHEPEVRVTRLASNDCLHVSTGASYDTR
jgi:hypothetical protein